MGVWQNTPARARPHSLTCTYQLFAESLVLGPIIPALDRSRQDVGMETGQDVTVRLTRRNRVLVIENVIFILADETHRSYSLAASST